MTDVNGRAESILTLGPNPGTNTVTVSVAGIPEGQTFNAVDIRVPKTLEIISGNDQQGLPGAALKKPFVIEVQDERDDAFEGVPVTFTVSRATGHSAPLAQRLIQTAGRRVPSRWDRILE